MLVLHVLGKKGTINVGSYSRYCYDVEKNEKLSDNKHSVRYAYFMLLYIMMCTYKIVLN